MTSSASFFMLAFLAICTDIVALEFFICQWLTNSPDRSISASMAADRGFGMLLTGFVFLHFTWFGARGPLEGASVCVALLGWIMILLTCGLDELDAVHKTGICVFFVGLALMTSSFLGKRAFHPLRRALAALLFSICAIFGSAYVVAVLTDDGRQYLYEHISFLGVMGLALALPGVYDDDDQSGWSKTTAPDLLRRWDI